MITQPSSLVARKQHIYQLIDSFPPERLAEISLFLEQLLNVVNTNIANQSGKSVSNPLLPNEEHPWLKFVDMYGDDFDWETFQAGIDEYRREIDAEEGVL